MIWCAVMHSVYFLTVWHYCWMWWDLLWVWYTTRFARILFTTEPLETFHQRYSQFTVFVPPTLGELCRFLCWLACWSWCCIKNERKNIFGNFSCSSVLHDTAQNYVEPFIIQPWYLSWRTFSSHIPLYVELPQGMLEVIGCNFWQ